MKNPAKIVLVTMICGAFAVLNVYLWIAPTPEEKERIRELERKLHEKVKVNLEIYRKCVESGRSTQDCAEERRRKERYTP